MSLMPTSNPHHYTPLTVSLTVVKLIPKNDNILVNMLRNSAEILHFNFISMAFSIEILPKNLCTVNQHQLIAVKLFTPIITQQKHPLLPPICLHPWSCGQIIYVVSSLLRCQSHCSGYTFIFWMTMRPTFWALIPISFGKGAKRHYRFDGQI